MTDTKDSSVFCSDCARKSCLSNGSMSAGCKNWLDPALQQNEADSASEEPETVVADSAPRKLSASAVEALRAWPDGHYGIMETTVDGTNRFYSVGPTGAVVSLASGDVVTELLESGLLTRRVDSRDKLKYYLTGKVPAEVTERPKKAGK